MATISEALATAVQHHRAGRLQPAEQIYRQILLADPDQSDAIHLLGVIAHQVGRYEVAADYIGHAIRLKPNAAEYHNSLSKTFQALGRMSEALASVRRAVELRPDFADAHHTLGNELFACGQAEEAALSYQRAAQLEPASFQAHYNRGLCLVKQGRLADAIACFRQALDINPEFADALFDLGAALKVQGDPAESIACLRRALALKPDHAVAHCNLGAALLAQGRIEEAAGACRRAIELEPALALAHNNLGNALLAGGQAEAAVACFETALRLQPDYLSARSNLLATLHYCPEITLPGLLKAHAEYDLRHAAPLREASVRHANSRDPERRLRIGFISPHFAEHPVGRFFIRPLEHMERRDFQICCYSDTAVNDALTARIQDVTDEWRDVCSMTDEALARRISDDRIDILFDLAGHTRGNRLGVFARQPAPVQISWMDYVGTTGLSAMDYLVADPRQIPVGAEPWYRERILRMPDDYICFDPAPHSPPVGPLPALTREGVTFGSFNILAKLNPRVVAVWARILLGVPRSRLLLKNFGWGDAATCERWRRLFLEEGITSDRLELRGWSPPAEAMGVYQEVDIALDPFPYNGGLTTCEALWMGVPVVTCPGETFASRHGLTHLTAAGVTETIAAGLDEYVNLAVGLAQDLPRLAALRAGLRDRVAASPLCDGPRFAAHFGQLLRTIWREWTQSRAASVHKSLVKAHHALGRIPEAAASDRRALELEPDLAEIQNNLGSCLWAEGRSAEAMVCFRRAVELEPDFVGALNNLGNACTGQGMLIEAVACYRRIVELRPGLARAHNNLGLACKRLGTLDEAVACYRRALALEPDFGEAHNNLGLVLIGQGKPDEAEVCCRRAVELAPGLAVAHNNLGIALKKLGRLEEAAASYGRALALKPDFAEARNNLGAVSMVQGKVEDAVASYRRALEMKPDFALGRLNLATALFHLGRYGEAWPEHEARLELFPPRRFAAPRWNHEPAEGKTILLHCEQGLGDTLQFVRYAGLAQARTKARRVILECQPPLARLLNDSVEAGIEIVARGRGEAADSALPEFDAHVPLLSLPLALGISEPLSMARPYLHADPALRAMWKARLAPDRRLRVGLAWQGSPTQARDRYRSMPAECLRPLLDIGTATFYSLQLGAGRTAAAALGEVGLLDFTEQIGDFADTAAFVCELDLIIAVDTAVVHLAGALGRPVWNLLTVVPHWPWGMKGETTPWYPTMRLFRQSEEGEWRGVVERVASELKSLPGCSPQR